MAHLYRCKTSGFLQLSAGGTGVTLVPVPTKTARTSISFHVMFLRWDVANPGTTMPFPNHLLSTSRTALLSQSVLIYFRRLGPGLPFI